MNSTTRKALNKMWQGKSWRKRGRHIRTWKADAHLKEARREYGGIR